MQLVGMHPGRVDEVAGGERLAARFKAEATALEPLDPGHRGVPAQLAARENRLGREGERRREGADDALVGHLERSGCPLPEVGLTPVELFDRELIDRAVTVRVRLLDDSGK